jgi:thymidylate kinase
MLIQDSTNRIDTEDYNKGPRTSLSSLSRLFHDLNDSSIRYCHWKSNLRLSASLKGETDLDLLVDRQQSGEFRCILFQHEIKPCIAAPGMRYPSLEDYLGFDQSSGKLFHLHVHYQLVLGEQFVKNYRIPIEDQVLNSVQLESGVNIPAPEVELSILCIRALLKYRDRDFIKDYFSIRFPGIPMHIRSEIEFLLNQTSLQEVDQVLSTKLGVLPKDIILEFLSIMHSNPRNGKGLFILRKNIRNALKDFQRSNRTKATLIYFKELWHRRSSFHPPKNKGKMTFMDGGITLALIGVDGAGKSTLHQQIMDWLSWKMDIHGFYLGSKQPSKTSELLYLIFRMLRRATSELNMIFSEDSSPARWLDSIKHTFLSAHYISIGYDRYRRFQAGTSLADSGRIVLYDRFPLEWVSSQPGYRLLDGPQIMLSDEQEYGRISKRLVSKEIDLYKKMRLPDYLLVLDVDPEVSVQRKPDHNRVILSEKYHAIQDLIANEYRYQLSCIDANLPYEDVLNELKSVVWKML